MNAATATLYVREMVSLERRGHGDTDDALRRLETHFGLPYWPAVHLRKGRAKTISTDLFLKIRVAYLNYCERKAGGLLSVVANEKEITPDATDLAALESELRAVAAKVAAARAKIGSGRRP